MKKKWMLGAFLSGLMILGFPVRADAADLDSLTSSIQNLFGGTAGTNDTIKIYVLLTFLTLVPTFLILTTSFTRIIMVLSFVRSSLGTQQNPPNQVLVGLALFLTFFIMQPVYQEVQKNAIKPLLNDEISQTEAFSRAEKPIKAFMLKETREKDIQLFLDVSETKNKDKPADLPLTIIIPAFMISELRTAFSIGFLLFLPFLVIDMAVSSILMSMGMFMLSPAMISLPFKLLLFVMVDGWYLVVESLVNSFH